MFQSFLYRIFILSTINYNLGHRERLKNRFLRSGSSGLSNYELLELLLTYAIPRKDVKNIAKDLLKTFGSIRGVMTAPPELLEQVNGIGKNSAVLINLAFALTMHCFQEEMQDNPVVADDQVLHNYLRMLIKDNSSERFFVLFLDKNDRLLGQWHSEGSRNDIKIDHLQLLKVISCQPGTKSIVVAHNHPSGISSPSQEDLNTTFQIRTVVAAFGIELKDHLIVTPEKVYSLLKHR